MSLFPRLRFRKNSGTTYTRPRLNLIVSDSDAGGPWISDDSDGDEVRLIFGAGHAALTVRESDGSPSLSDVEIIEVTNGTLTNPLPGIARIVSPSWTAFTPSWTGTVTNPVIGDGTLAAAYRLDGKTLHLRYEIIMGSTTTYGSGTWGLSLPSGFTSVASRRQLIAAHSADASTSLRYSGVLLLGGGATLFSPISLGSGTGNVTATVPFTWAQNDVLVAEGALEVQ